MFIPWQIPALSISCMLFTALTIQVCQLGYSLESATVFISCSRHVPPEIPTWFNLCQSSRWVVFHSSTGVFSWFPPLFFSWSGISSRLCADHINARVLLGCLCHRDWCKRGCSNSTTGYGCAQHDYRHQYVSSSPSSSVSLTLGGSSQ